MNKYFNLSNTLSRNSNGDPKDTLKVKQTLHKLGYMEEPSYGIDDMPDKPLFDGIKDFQIDKGLKADGVMKPGGETEESMFRKPSKTEPTKVAVSDQKNQSMANKNSESKVVNQALINTNGNEEITTKQPNKKSKINVDSLFDTIDEVESKKPNVQVAQANTGFGTDAYYMDTADAFTEAGEILGGQAIKDSIEIGRQKGSELFKKGKQSIGLDLDPPKNRWDISENLDGLDDPRVLKLMKRMDGFRDLSYEERRQLDIDIDKLGLGENALPSIAGSMKNKLGTVRKEPFKFPHIMTDDELFKHLGVSRDVSEVSETIKENLKTLKPVMTGLKMLLGERLGKELGAGLDKLSKTQVLNLIDISNKINLGHYRDREKAYIIELTKRGMLKELEG